jgi:O-antigen/teichoic acid export membrane protein
VAAGGAETLAFKGLEVLAQLVLVAVTARLMEPAGRGLFALASFAAVVCGLPLGSVWTANAVEVAKRRTGTPELVWSSVVIAVVGGLATAALALAISPALGDDWWVLGLPALATPFLLLARYQEGLFQALGRVRAVNLVSFGRVALPLAFITPALVVGASDRTAIAWWALAFAALALLGLAPLARAAGGVRRPRRPGLYRRLLRFGATLAVGNSASLINNRIALVLLAAFASTATVGVYSVAIAASEMLLLTTLALDVSSFRGITSGERAASVALTARTIRHAALLSSVGALVLIPVVYVALPVVVGDGYGDVATILIVLAPGLVLQAAAMLMDGFFAVQLHRPALVTRISLLMLCVNVPLGLILIPFLGAWGAALAATLASAVGASVYLTRFRAASGVPLGALVPGRAELRDYAALASSLAARRRPA